MDESAIQRHSGGWLFYVKAAFGISLGLMVLGIVWLPTDLWIKGYLVMGIMFVVGSNITLAKTLRDDHEARRLINRISEAKTERLLKEYTERTTHDAGQVKPSWRRQASDQRPSPGESSWPPPGTN